MYGDAVLVMRCLLWVLPFLLVVELFFMSRSTHHSLQRCKRSVMGTASIVNDPEGKRTGLAVIMAQYTDKAFHFSEKMMADTAVVRVDIEEIQGKRSA